MQKAFARLLPLLHAEQAALASHGCHAQDTGSDMAIFPVVMDQEIRFLGGEAVVFSQNMIDFIDNRL